MPNVCNPDQVFTRVELALYNGQNGKPAYVAVNGTVYDVTTVFIQGRHFEHVAGQDLTGAFLRQHVPAALSGYPVVGRLVN
ncbi:MAG: cytochrome b5 domain-containing protein [Bacillota bacterium]